VPGDTAFDALGYTFAVDSDDEDIRADALRLFDALRTSNTAAHHYRVTSGGDAQEPELVLDGESVRSADDPRMLVSALVHHVNARAIETCPFPTIHAGCVAYDGAAIALSGSAAAGKSTLTAGLVRAGFAYLSDEAIGLDDDTMQVQPYPKPITLDRGSWSFFPELAQSAFKVPPAHGAEQWHVPVSAIRAHAVGEPCPLRVVVFPSYRSGAEVRLEPVTRAQALAELASQTFAFSERARPALEVIAEAIRDAECFRLETGALDEAVATVASTVGARVPKPSAA